MDGFDEGVGGDGDAVDPFFDEELGELGEVGGALAADADFDAGGFGGSDEGGEEGLDGLVAFVAELGDAGQVTVEAERELGQVIGANGEAVDVAGKFPGEDNVGGNLGHEIKLETGRVRERVQTLLIFKHFNF